MYLARRGRAALDEVEVEHEVQRGQAHHEQAEGDPDRRRAWMNGMLLPKNPCTIDTRYRRPMAPVAATIPSLKFSLAG
jgi:hypothetical protein